MEPGGVTVPLLSRKELKSSFFLSMLRDRKKQPRSCWLSSTWAVTCSTQSMCTGFTSPPFWALEATLPGSAMKTLCWMKRLTETGAFDTESSLLPGCICGGKWWHPGTVPPPFCHVSRNPFQPLLCKVTLCCLVVRLVKMSGDVCS